MQDSKLAQKLLQIQDTEIYFDEPMKNHTTFKIGGPADIFIVAKQFHAFENTLKACKESGVPFHVIGAGSNLLASDKGVRGAIIKFASNTALCSGNIITAHAGISLASLAKFALSNSLSGLEFASGIPGLLGGAVYMNAGAYGGEMKDIVEETQYLDSSGNLCVMGKNEHMFSYRHSAFSSGDKFVVLTKLKLCHGDKQEIAKTMNDLLKRRNDKQPLNFPSAGSTFKRPEGYFAAKLVEDAGLKGYSVGGAKVSEKHSGFVINTGNATASDVLLLIDHIKNTVLKMFNVELCCEIKMIGEF